MKIKLAVYDFQRYVGSFGRQRRIELIEGEVTPDEWKEIKKKVKNSKELKP